MLKNENRWSSERGTNNSRRRIFNQIWHWTFALKKRTFRLLLEFLERIYHKQIFKKINSKCFGTTRWHELLYLIEGILNEIVQTFFMANSFYITKYSLLILLPLLPVLSFSFQLPELSQFAVGLMHIQLLHTSASLAINENWDPDVRDDMEMMLNRIVPEDVPFRHSCEGPDDMVR